MKYIKTFEKIDDDFYEIGEKDIIRKASNVEIKAIKYNI
jgi:hypothetical protein